MEALGLTSQQTETIARRGRDVLVTAGAGSGKTRVLVERYVSLLGECSIPQIAAVTFTDAAASEMRERVRKEVINRPELAAHRAHLDEAVIGTIHSLCSRILREHPVEAAIDPAARTLAEDEAELEIRTACADALEEAADADDIRALALREIGTYSLTNHLPLMVARRNEVEAAYKALPGTPPTWADEIRARLDTGVAAAMEQVRPWLVESAAWLQDALAGAEGDVFSTRLGHFLETLGDPDEGDWRNLLARVAEADKHINLRGGTARKWARDLDAVKDKLRAFRETADRLDKLPRWNEHDDDALQALDSLRDLFRDACARYAARKKELAAMDYLDLELKTEELLSSHPDVAASYRSRFRHLMVDELQDTNPAQIAVLRLLSRGGGAGQPAPERFFVGDVKQAIYRFRGSDVRHFTRLQREMQADGDVLSLNRSFRTHDPLVEILNVIFGRVFGDSKEEFDAPMQAMTGRGSDSPPSPHLVLMPVSDKTPGADGANGFDRRRVEADAVAREVASLLEHGELVWDRERKSYRAARPSDVAILLRRLTNVHLFEQALESHGVPYRTPAGGGFFTRQEVLDLTNLLGWLAEPDDDIALVGVLRSPLFIIDDQTLLNLRSSNRPLLDALRGSPSSVSGKARLLCTRAAEVLADLRRDVPFAAPDTLLEKALTLTGFEAVWAAMQGGDQALANIRKFVTLARTLASHSLDELVTYVRRRRDDLEAREGQAVLDASEAVRLLTVHGAKGLEFPIVFVPETHVPSRGTYEPVRWRAEEGISLTLDKEIGGSGNRRRPGFYSHLMERDNREEASEHKRLLYVAATRAADKLYLSGDDPRRQDGELGGDGWLAYVFDALGESHVEGVEVRSPLPVDLDAIARRPAPSPVAVPSADDEQDIMPPLVARPPVIPLRSSTPVTALRKPPSHAPARHGDGLALFRGTLAHRAIELWFTSGERPPLVELSTTFATDQADREIERVASDVDAMLDLLDASPFAATLRDQGTRAYFELPFSWDWNGAPVHGTIDLAYESGGAWHVVDFKTDDTRKDALAEAVAPYLPQLALYSSALARAIGQRPKASLLFLRTCQLYTPPLSDLNNALHETRARMNAGQMLEMAPSPTDDDPAATSADV